MLLILFDVDGTLTESFDLDSATYLDALQEAFGFEDVSDDWAQYRHVTDAGVLAEICQTRWGRSPDVGEVAQFQECYLALLVARLETTGGLAAIAGTPEVLLRAMTSPDRYGFAYATGGWKRAALCKLQAAGLPTFVPAAFSDDALTQEEICKLARRRAEQRSGEAFDRVVSVGDGAWDVRAAKRLGYGFVGIGSGERATRLRQAGAVEVLPGFQETDAFFAAVEREAARLPALSRSAGTAASAR